ncbi:MAG: hypothetical protein ACRDBI_00560, partial [Shewanella sp.]
MTKPPIHPGQSAVIAPEELALQQEVTTWYHLQATEMPSKKLDEDIVALARRQLAVHKVAVMP